MSNNENRVFSWGANSYGQLGHNHTDDLLVPTPISPHSIPADLDVDNITKITGGGGHLFLLTGDGKLFGCGQNNKGQLGIGDTDSKATFQQIENLKAQHIIDIACGWEHTLALTDKGEVYAWGSNAYSQLGTGNLDLNNSGAPHILCALQGKGKIKVITAGLYHSAAIDEHGNVYTWGNGKKGQLGITEPDGKLVPEAALPQQVSGVKGAKSVICGSHHTAVLLDNNEIWMWGCTKYGQITDPVQRKIVPNPLQVPGITDQIAQIHSGWTHMVALAANGELFTWGRNTYGQLGRDTTDKFGPTKVDTRGNAICQVSTGAEHNLAITDKNAVMAWGWNEHGMCGNGTEEPVPQPQIISELSRFEALRIGCAAGSSIAIGRMKE